MTIKSEESNIKCVKLRGEVGLEDIECSAFSKEKEKALYQTFKGVRMIRVESFVENRHYTWKCIDSPIIVGDGINSILDYSDCPSSPEIITIGDDLVKIGLANYTLTEKKLTKGTIILPSTPKIQGLTTRFTDCNHDWTLVGHTNLLVEASEIQSNCIIDAKGKELDAEIEVNFNPFDDQSCNPTSVTVDVNEDKNGFLLNVNGDSTVILGPLFIDATIKGSPCNDNIIVENAPQTAGTIFIDTRGGDDSLTINKLSEMYKNMDVIGGNGTDILNIDDKESTKFNTADNAIVLNSFALRNIQPDSANLDLVYRSFETINIDFSQGGNTINVTSTAKDSVTTLTCGQGMDTLNIDDTQGDLFVYGGDGNDLFNVNGLGGDTDTTIEGQAHDDTIVVDGTDPGPNGNSNRLEDSYLFWNGGDNDDTADITFAGSGKFTMQLFGDTEGTNKISFSCTEESCDLLSRENFIAAIHDINNPDTSTAERVEIKRADDDDVDGCPKYDNEVDSITIELGDATQRGTQNKTRNSIFFDDTLATITVTGGDDADWFYIGQLYNGFRDDDQTNKDR